MKKDKDEGNAENGGVEDETPNIPQRDPDIAGPPTINIVQEGLKDADIEKAVIEIHEIEKRDSE